MRNRGGSLGGKFLASVLLGASLFVLSAPVSGLLTIRPAWAADAFVEGFEDLPLMPGLKQVAGSAVAFDSPYGRIVESVARGNVAPGGVLSFYDRTLPQLGWTRTAPGEFRREGEALSLDVSGQGAAVEVRFQVSPRG